MNPNFLQALAPTPFGSNRLLDAVEALCDAQEKGLLTAMEVEERMDRMVARFPAKDDCDRDFCTGRTLPPPEPEPVLGRETWTWGWNTRVPSRPFLGGGQLVIEREAMEACA